MEVWTQGVPCKVNMTPAPWRHVNFARDPLRSYFHEPQKNEIHHLYLYFVFFTSFLTIICEILI